MASIRVERVPPEERRPNEKYQVTVDGSVISRHRTAAQARERKLEASGQTADKVKNMVERAAESAKIGLPVSDASLDPVGESRVDELASASPSTGRPSASGDQESPEEDQYDLLGETRLDEMASATPMDVDAEAGYYDDGSKPDWDDNPENLDTPEEVRAEERSRGLDPVDVDTREHAIFGNMLLHHWEHTPDHGGRTPAELEAEHDMVSDALDDFGVDHTSPMDVDDIEGEDDLYDVGVDFDFFEEGEAR